MALLAKNEYIATRSCYTQLLWIKQQLSDYGLNYQQIPIICDNTSAINLTKNPVMQSKTKHIQIHHHFLRDYVQKDGISLRFIQTDLQLTDIFTKPLDEK